MRIPQFFFEKNIRWRCQWYRKWNKLTALKKNSRPPSDFQSRLFVAIDEFLLAGFCHVDLTANRSRRKINLTYFLPNLGNHLALNGGLMSKL